MNTRLDHVWFVNTIWFHVSINEKCGINDVKAFREVRSQKNSRFWCLNTYHFTTGQNFSKILSAIYTLQHTIIDTSKNSFGFAVLL